MPYDAELEKLIDDAATGIGAEKRKMFGGLCYLTGGNMFGGVYKNFLIVRLGESEAQRALSGKGARPFDITGRPMKGWVMVDKSGWEGGGLKAWLKMAMDFASSLPPKR